MWEVQVPLVAEHGAQPASSTYQDDAVNHMWASMRGAGVNTVRHSGKLPLRVPMVYGVQMPS